VEGSPEEGEKGGGGSATTGTAKLLVFSKLPKVEPITCVSASVNRKKGGIEVKSLVVTSLPGRVRLEVLSVKEGEARKEEGKRPRDPGRTPSARGSRGGGHGFKVEGIGEKGGGQTEKGLRVSRCDGRRPIVHTKGKKVKVTCLFVLGGVSPRGGGRK